MLCWRETEVSCPGMWRISRIVLKPKQIDGNMNPTKTKEATSATAKAEEEKQMEAALSAAKEAIPTVKKEAEVEEAISAAAKAEEEKQMEAAVSAAKEANSAVKKEAEVEKSGEAVAPTCQMANRPARRREVG